jgi:hypothetical protein
MSRRVEAQWCPSCFERIDMTPQIVTLRDLVTHEAKARPGDYTVCIKCAALLRFGRKMLLKIIDASEVEDKATRAKLLTVSRTIKELRKENPINVWKN